MITFLNFKRLLLLLSFLCSYALSFAQCDVLVWSDEFEGTGAPNSAYWNYDLGAGGWGNNEVQTYTNSTTNVRQENGKLIIDAIKSGGSWTSGRIKTQNKMTFTYGKLVFRAKLPTGTGTWPALWMLGQNIGSKPWPACGEIDVMEHVGRNQNTVQSALHMPSNFGGNAVVRSTTVSTASSEFHDYTVSWNANRISFYIDGVHYHTYNPASKNDNNYPFNWDFFLIMNIAMGGNLGGAIDPALTSARMEVEYVRLYEERTSPLISGPAFVHENQTNLQFSAPEYTDADYQWTIPANAELISGQGTKDITVNWGDSDGTVQLTIEGETGCSVNAASLNVATTIQPEGEKYLAHSFTTNALTGWTTNGGGNVAMTTTGGKLNVNYTVSDLRYIQFALPKPINLSEYGIIKLPIRVPASSATIPNLFMTFSDGYNNETVATRFELDISQKDGTTKIYSYNFDNQWAPNSPAVDPHFIKYVRIYMQNGNGSFSLDDLYFYNSETASSAPANVTATVTGRDVQLEWEDLSNATAFHLYRSDSETGTYTRVKSNLKTSENPYTTTPPAGANYYRISGVNAKGESELSQAAEAIVIITATEDELSDVSIFPNPSAGTFTITLPDQNIDRIDLYDLQGRSLSYQTLIRDKQIILAITHPEPGLYFIRLLKNNSSRVYKLLVD